ncbi:hypothetical protein BaRGS_00022345 [Batillaria attramentaria]|uniref:Lipase maturation factor n=1 Tax=Batillaria attramentaria TaxID=370345 RepID=A0ABD0KH82_9CAEN
MASVAFTQDLFLWFMAIVYLFAFSSLYVQIPGLYGDKGLMPARLVMDKGRDFVSFSLLWILYLSLYQVGQTFLWFQWDILLLEAGFLSLLVAPLILPFTRIRYGCPHDYITLWLVRWLLFRLMFASGVVKLTSQCPTWWGLTALTVHFESQCIPTPMAWYWHHFPDWFLKLGVVGTYVIEIGFPFLFFVPVRSLRIISFYSQVLLQVLIIATGNYNFFNILTIALCIPLVDDDIILGGPRTFSEKQFLDWLERIMPWTMRLGAASLALEIVVSLVRSFTWYKSFLRRNWSVVQSLFFAAVAATMFSLSLVPHFAVHKPPQQSLPEEVLSLHSHTRPFHLVSSYGLFRRMTGVGGRPEVIVEGSFEKDSGWKEYNFLYKPGNVSARPPVVAPHQPRLDWQMWFAALDNYQLNPWFVTLMYRLLTAQPEVLELMGDNPFPDKAPNYVRATLYHYHFTSDKPGSKGYSTTDWWWRTRQAEYIPVMSKDLGTLKEFLQHYRILEVNEHQRKQQTVQF